MVTYNGVVVKVLNSESGLTLVKFPDNTLDWVQDEKLIYREEEK